MKPYTIHLFFIFFLTVIEANSQSAICLQPASYDPLGFNSLSYFAYADLNNDGFQDLIDTNGPNLTTHLSIGGNGFDVATTTYTMNVGFTKPWVTDINGDSKADIVVGTNATMFMVSIGNGLGGFSSSSPIISPGIASALALEDFNNDLKKDVIIVDGDSLKLYYFTGNGNGSFNSPSTQPASNGASLDIYAFDINSDGKKDLVLQDYQLVTFLGNLGAGTFTQNGQFVNSGYTKFADFNADGKMDFALIDTNSTIKLLKGLGGFSFTPINTLTPGVDPSTIDVADFNSDGKTDIVSGNVYYDYSIMLNTGNFTFNSVFHDTVNVSAATSYGGYVMAADFNNDNKSDLFIGMDNGEPVHIYLNCNTVGMEENRSLVSSELKFYPNPATDYISIEGNFLIDNIVTVDIYNGIGELVKKQKMKVKEQTSMSIGDLCSGAYVEFKQLIPPDISKPKYIR